MAYEYREPDVVETHTSREVVVDRDTGSSGAVIGIVLAALLVLGLIGYFAWWSPRGSVDSGRAQEIRVDAPDVNVSTPDVHMPDVNVTSPDVNVQPPDVNITPPTTNDNSGTRDNASGQ
ncbi:MAG TPA: hypothetical protein VK934_09260 [Fimbriimonas sp.]|nr:hypothetical protein [Fimbriimonas sp.]